MTKQTAAPEAEVKSVQDQDANMGMHIMAALTELFGDAQEHVVLPSRKEPVCFYAAKMKHLSQIGALVQGMVAALDHSELKALLTLVSADQVDKINNGVSPFSLNTTEVVKSALGTTPLGIRLVTGAHDLMVEMAPTFTNLKKGEFEELDLDEGLVVVFGVFARNYAFFTQRLLPLIVASIANLKARKS